MTHEDGVRLKVAKARAEDIYRDYVRVHELYRKTSKGTVVHEGSVSKITVAGRSAYLVARGSEDETPSIAMDERTRNQLHVDVGQEVDVIFSEHVGLFGQLRWAWNTSDLAYRASARIAIVSFGLGVIGLVLGVISLVK